MSLCKYCGQDYGREVASRDDLDGKRWTIYGDSAFQIFNWLTPFIEKAGYNWRVNHHITENNPTFGGWDIEITKHE